MEGAGEVESVTFVTDITEIEQLSNRLKEGWETRSHMVGSDDVPYLIKRNVTRQLPVSLEDTECSGTGTILCSVQDSRDDLLQEEESEDPVVDGKLLTLEEVWRLVPGSYQERLRHERWTFITQQEHPLLGRPFFQLHPCRTADLMKAVSPPSRGNYVVTWLSSVGPVVGIDLPLAFAKLCQTR